MSRGRKIAIAVLAVVILLVGAVYTLVGTESGTRWLFARASASLPPALSISEPAGSLLDGLRVDSLEWRDETLDIEAESISISIRFLPLFSREIAVERLAAGRLSISRFADDSDEPSDELPQFALPLPISIATSTLQDVAYRDGDIELTVNEIRFAGEMRGPRLDTLALTIDRPDLQLDVDGDISFTGDYPLALRTDWRWTDSAGEAYSGRLQLNGNLRRSLLTHELAEPLSIDTRGSVSLADGDWSADLENEWSALAWNFGERRLESTGGSLEFRGNDRAADVLLDAVLQLDDWPATHVVLDGAIDRDGLRIDTSELTAAPGRLSASGDLSWVDEQSFDVLFSVSGVDPSQWWQQAPGSMDASGRVSGQLAPDIMVAIRLDQMGGVLRDQPLAASGAFSYANDTLEIDGGEFSLGSNSARVNGSIGADLAVNAELDFRSLSDLLDELSGTLAGTVALDGPRAAPNADFDLQGRNLSWQDYSAAGVELQGRYADAVPGNIAMRAESLTVFGRMLDTLSMVANGVADRHELGIVARAYGTELAVDSSGSYSDGEWRGSISDLSFVNDATGRWSSREPGTLEVAASHVSLATMCLHAADDGGRTCIAGGVDESGSASADIEISGLPIAALPLVWPADVTVAGHIDAGIRGNFTDDSLYGDAEIQLVGAAFDTTIDGEQLAVSLPLAEGRATVVANRTDASFRFAIADDAGSGDMTLQVEAITDPESPLSGEASVSIDDAAIFGILVPDLANPRGVVTGQLQLGGSLAAPRFTGALTLDEGSFGVRQAGIEITDIEARMQQRAPGQLQLTGSARSGEGLLSVEGETEFGTATGIRTTLTIRGEAFELVRLPEWQVEASPDIAIVFDEQRTAVSGELEIPSAAIRIRQIPETAVAPSPDTVVHRAEGAQATNRRRIDVDVQTSLGDDVQFAGFGLTTAISGTLDLQGGTHDPFVGRGRLALRDGSYKAYGQELEIERGELIFNGPLDNPQLDIRAVRSAQDVVAGIELTGTPRNLSSRVFSEPPLGDAQALSYLLTGRPLAGAAEGGEGDTLNNAAFALGMSGAGQIASQIRTGLGLETLTVEGGAEDGKLIAGKRFGNRLLVEYGYGLVDRLGTLLLRYQLNERIILESRTGAVSNLDIVYSVKKQ